MEITLETLMKRRSVRSYSGQPLSTIQRVLLEQVMLKAAGPCLFGHQPRFRLAGPGLIPGEGTGNAPASFKIGTYGLVKNPPAFIIGAVAAGPGAVLDYGYALEGIILAATATGLGTCWLGGTFDRNATKEFLDLKEGELIPAITPVGLPAEQRSLTERTMRFLARSDSRKPWDQLFYDGQLDKPLDMARAGEWTPVLEAVRMGPSASNKQPWRVLRDDPSHFSLLFAEDRGYNNALGLPIQELDLGIAMKHFELAARACGLPGNWSKGTPPSAPHTDASGNALRYIASCET